MHISALLEIECFWQYRCEIYLALLFTLLDLSSASELFL